MIFHIFDTPLIKIQKMESKYMSYESNSNPIVPPLNSNSGFKDYYCPHCREFILKGNVKRLNMSCPHCSRMISVDEKDLFLQTNEE